MKAKIKTLIILMAIFSVSLIAGVFAGCIGEKDAKQRADELGMTACVTYYTNGGNFVSGSNTTDAKAYRTDYYYPDTPIFNIGVDETAGQSLSIKRDNYVFAGWVYAELDANGLPKLYELDANGNINLTGAQLTVLENGTASIIGSTGREMLEQEKRFGAVGSDVKVFENGHPKVAAGEHVYLVATWVVDVVLEYRLITDAPITVQENGKAVTYQNGDVINTRGFSTNSSLSLSPNSVPKSFTGFSYIHLYWDENCERPVVAGEQIEKGDGVNSVIYAKYISGSWKPVRDANDVVAMLSDDSNYYVVWDIDCAEYCEKNSFAYNTGSFGGVIEGNNHIISNVKIAGNFRIASNPGSILGNLRESAKIRNLKFKDVTVNLSLNCSMYAYVLVSTVAEGAVIENVSLDTVTFNIVLDDGGKLYNIQYVNDAYQTGNWLYGAYNTDEEFINKYGDLVQNATLIINKEIVSGGSV